MKKSMFALLPLLAASWAWAESPAEVELLSAQKAYQAALKGQTDTIGRVTELHSQLQSAQTRLTQTQAEVNRLQGEVAQADAARSQSDSALAAAGARLDAAWTAVRGGQ